MRFNISLFYFIYILFSRISNTCWCILANRQPTNKLWSWKLSCLFVLDVVSLFVCSVFNGSICGKTKTKWMQRNRSRCAIEMELVHFSVKSIGYRIFYVVSTTNSFAVPNFWSIIKSLVKKFKTIEDILNGLIEMR